MSVEDVDSTKLIKTSEVENSNSTFRKGQLRDTCPAGSDNFETKLKDHELEEGTEALVPLSAGRHLAAQHSDAGSSTDWVEDRQGRCADSSEKDLMTAKKYKTQKKPHDQKQMREKQCSSEGLTNIVCNIRNIVFRTPTFGFVCPAEYKNELGQRCVSINAAAANHLGGDGAGRGFCDPERWSMLRRHQDTFDAEGCNVSHEGAQQDRRR